MKTMPSAVSRRRRRSRIQQRSAPKLAVPLGRWLLVALLIVSAIGGLRFVRDEYETAQHEKRRAQVGKIAVANVPPAVAAQVDAAPALHSPAVENTPLVPINAGRSTAFASVTSALVAQLTTNAPASAMTIPPAVPSALPRNARSAVASSPRMVVAPFPDAPRVAFAGVPSTVAPVTSSGLGTSTIVPPNTTSATAVSTHAPSHAFRQGSPTSSGPIVNAGPTLTWAGTGASTNSNWSNGSNWTGGTAPSPTGLDDIIFTSTPAASTASTVDGSYTINSLTFQAGTPSYTIGSGGENPRLRFGDSSSSFSNSYLINYSANAQTLNVPLLLGAPLGTTVIVASGSLTVNGAISGSSAIYKAGAGTLVLTSNNPYTNNITLDQGTIDVRNNGALGTSALVVNGGSIANNATVGDGLANPITLANPIALNGNLDHGNSNASLTFTGPVFLDATTRTISASNVNSDPSSGNGFNVTFNGVISAANTTTGLTFANSAHDVFVLGGSGSNTYTGLTTVDAATLSLQKDAGVTAIAGDLTVRNGGRVFTDGGQVAPVTHLTVNTGGIFDATGNIEAPANETVASLNGDNTGTVLIGNQYTRTVLTAQAGTVNGLIRDGFINVPARGTTPAVEPSSAGGALFKTGPATLTLTHNNTYSGGTVVGQGTLTVNNVPNGDNVSGTGSGTVTVLGTGKLSGFGTIAGAVTVGGGEGTAVLAPGDGIGRLSMLSTLTLASNAQVQIELGGATAGAQYDQAFIGGPLTLDGTLNVKLVNGFVPFVGEKFYILDVTTGDGVTGEFANVTNGLYTDAAGNLYQVNYNDSDLDGTNANGARAALGNDVSLTFLAVPEPGSLAATCIGLTGCALLIDRRRRQSRVV